MPKYYVKLIGEEQGSYVEDDNPAGAALSYVQSLDREVDILNTFAFTKHKAHVVVKATSTGKEFRLFVTGEIKCLYSWGFDDDEDQDER